MTTPLSELVSRLALLAAPYAYLMTARLLKGAPVIELRATRGGASVGQEYVRQVSFSALEQRGPAAIAREFAREARAALAAGPERTIRMRARRQAG